MTAAPNNLSFPVGPLVPSIPATRAVRDAAVADLAALPRLLRAAVAGLSDNQLDTPYRPGGWTVRQLVHHIADSHMNGYIRVKLALAEDAPTIKPYDQDTWATLRDSRLALEPSLSILDGLHTRWVRLYDGLDDAAFGRTFFHPEMNASLTLEWHLQQYAWHSRHHVAHITALRARAGWGQSDG